MRRGFTLIELIFVIVIIGLLAAIAVPKFVNLKQHAKANAAIKTTLNAAHEAVSAASNKYNLDNNTSFTLRDLITVTGKGWEWEDNNNTCYYIDPAKGSTNINDAVATISLDTTNRDVNYTVNCLNFEDKNTQKYCEGLINNRQTIKEIFPY